MTDGHTHTHIMIIHTHTRVHTTHTHTHTRTHAHTHTWQKVKQVSNTNNCVTDALTSTIMPAAKSQCVQVKSCVQVTHRSDILWIRSQYSLLDIPIFPLVSVNCAMFISTFGSTVAWYMSKQLSRPSIFKADIICSSLSAIIARKLCQQGRIWRTCTKAWGKGKLSLCVWSEPL